MKCKRCGAVRGLIDGLCDNCSLEVHGCLFPWLDGHDHTVCERLVANMNDEKECTHARTQIQLTKSGIKKVCKDCGTVVKDLSEEVTIEKVILPMPNLEKTLEGE